MSTQDESGHPLGYCTECHRVRWISEPEKQIDVVREGKTTGQMPVGRCTQCVREGTGPGPELLGPSPSENFEVTGEEWGAFSECAHGYTSGCPDCDVPSHMPEVLGIRSGLLLWEDEGEKTHAELVGTGRTLCIRPTSQMLSLDLDAMTNHPTCPVCLERIRRSVSRLLAATMGDEDD